jgi:hypothetical protein
MEYKTKIVHKKGMLNVLSHQFSHMYDMIPLDHKIHVSQQEKFSKRVEVAANSTSGDKLQLSTAGTDYPMVIANTM